MKQRIYLNVCAELGRSSFKEPRIPYRLDQLIDDMRYYRIHTTCACSAEAISYSFVAGNNQIIEVAKSEKTIIPFAVVPAFAPFETGEGIDYYQNLIDNGVKGFVLAPNKFNEAFIPFFYHKLMDFMSENKIPAFIKTNQSDIRDIVAMAEAYPKVSFVILSSNWGENRMIYSAMSALDNLYMDIGSNQANDLLKICKQQGFLNRVLFGTDYPNKDIGGVKALVEYADITEDEKDLVAYKNACKLLNIDEKSFELFSDDSLELDEIACAIDQGETLNNIKINDSHTHIVEDGVSSVSALAMLNSGFDCVIEKMDRIGINTISVSTWEGVTTNGTNANLTVLKGMQKYPNRIYGYACCNPNYEEDISSLFEFYDTHKFPGAKPYWPNNGRLLTDELYTPWFEYLNQNKLMMLIHSEDLGRMDMIKETIEKYPDISFILAHTGCSYSIANAHVELCKTYPNVWLEITYTALTYGMIEYLVESVGAEKVLYGSDLPMRDPAPQVAWVGYAKISVEDKKKILGSNFDNILNRCYSR